MEAKKKTGQLENEGKEGEGRGNWRGFDVTLINPRCLSFRWNDKSRFLDNSDIKIHQIRGFRPIYTIDRSIDKKVEERSKDGSLIKKKKKKKGEDDSSDEEFREYNKIRPVFKFVER